MKRISILFIIILSSYTTSKAQIALDSSNFSMRVNETDTLDMLGGGGMPKSPEPGKNLSIDYYNSRNSVFTILSTTSYSAPVSNKFKTATRSSVQSITPNQPINPNYNATDTIKNTFYFTDNSYGYGYTGYSVDKRQVLADRHGDSLIFNVFDTSIATNPQYIMKYPAAYDSTWSYSARLTYPLQFYVSPVGIYGYYPGLESIYRTVTDSVVGWGNMIVPTDSGAASTAYPVIMVKENWIDIDSFWVSLPSYSSISTGDVLNYFSLNQGQTNKNYTYSFYRAGYSASLMKFWAMDPNYKYITAAGFDPNNTMPTGIKNISVPAVAGIFPNPVTSSGFTVTFARQDNMPKLLTITNSLGQVVQSLPLLQNQTTALINVPPGLANGMYYYTITETGGGGTVNGKFVLAR